MGVSLRPDRQSAILSIATHNGALEYGPLAPSPDYLDEMTALVHPSDVLNRAGYTLHKLSPEDLDQKRRCFWCNRKWVKKSSHHGTSSSRQTPKRAPPRPDNPASSPQRAEPSRDQPQPHFRCKSHDGGVVQGKWTCCNGNRFAPGCIGRDEHIPRIYANGELERQWAFFHTPAFNSRGGSSRPAAAVVIDCEMGTNMYGESELIRVSVVDYFSRAVLLDSLVWPDVRMVHYNTKFSGVTFRAMLDAKKRRTCIFGRANVRERIWRFVGPDTIVVGHAAQGDLSCLRWIHPRVVDTLIIETRNRPPPPPPPSKERDDPAEDAAEEAQAGAKEVEEGGDPDEQDADQAEEGASLVAPVPSTGQNGGEDQQKAIVTGERKQGGLSLKALALAHLDRTIQIKGRGHDSVEDALATRDILHWNIVKIFREKVEAGASSSAYDLLLLES